MYEKLKSEFQEIITLVESLPEKYREKSFDLLVTQLLSEQTHKKTKVKVEEESEIDDSPVSETPRQDSNFVVPAKVKVFMRRHNVSEKQLRGLALIEDDIVHFIREPHDVAIARGQIQWSLLLALRSALLGGDMLVDPEAVRSIVQEKGFYDKKNFASIFRNNADNFASAPALQGPPVRLSAEGEKALAELIKQLVPGE